MKLTVKDFEILIDVMEDNLYELRLEEHTSNREFVTPAVQEQTEVLKKLRQLLNELTT